MHKNHRHCNAIVFTFWLVLFTTYCDVKMKRFVLVFISHYIDFTQIAWWILVCKAERQYLFTCDVSRYCLLVLVFLRRWSNIVQMFYKCFVFIGIPPWLWLGFGIICFQHPHRQHGHMWSNVTQGKYDIVWDHGIGLPTTKNTNWYFTNVPFYGDSMLGQRLRRCPNIEST